MYLLGALFPGYVGVSDTAVTGHILTISLLGVWDNKVAGYVSQPIVLHSL